LEESTRQKVLESLRNATLRSEENAWRLRSRATWLKSSDSNSKFFHNVAS